MNEVMDTLAEWWGLLDESRWIKASLFVLLAVIAAKLADWICSGVIAAWARRSRTDVDDRLIQYLHRPVFVSVAIVGLGAATRTLELGPTVTWATLAALKTISVLVWLGFGLKTCRLLLDVLERHGDRFSFVTSATLPLFDVVLKFVMVGGALYFVFLSWKIDVTAWLASAGILGLALSFAAKDSLANLFAGLFILADAPYAIGDYVVLDSGERGEVTRIGMRSTRLLTRDDVEVTIPNSVMGNAKIVNESGGPHLKSRVRVQVGVSYGSDVDQVERVLMRIALDHDEVCDDPEPRVRFRVFGSSSLDFELLCWIGAPVDRGRLLHELNKRVYKAFAAEGITIPFPQQDVWVKQIPRALQS